MLNKKFLITITIISISIILLIYFFSPLKKMLRPGMPNLVSGNGNLYVQGNKIYNKYNEPIQLKGISSHGLQWYGNLLTYENFKHLRDNWGINVFRLAMYTEENGYIYDKSVKNKLIESVDNLISLDMYVVIDWHILSDGNPMTHINESKDFFNEISLKYANCPNVIYEICNEPNNTTWKDSIKPYANEIIPIIRKNSPDSLIIIGTPNWSSNITEVINSPLQFSNIAYSYHFYSGSHYFSHNGELKKAIDNNLCIFVSEWGTTDLTGNSKLYLDSATKWLDFLDENKISWINWSFCNKDEASAILKPLPLNSSEDIDNNLSDSGQFIKSRISTK